jgi:mycothiol synthase
MRRTYRGPIAVSGARYARSAVIQTRVLHPVAPGDLVAVTRLHDEAEALDGHSSLGEAVWRDLDRPVDERSAGVLATDNTERAVGYAHVFRSDNEFPPHWVAGVVVHPDLRAGDVEQALLEQAVAYAEEAGGGLVVLWIFDPDERDDRAAERAGFRHQRDLLQLRVPLPAAETPAWPPGVEVRLFVPGRDDQAWLEVNNRAFADHPEQGGWDAETLRRRLAEPWFDPKGFLLAIDDDGLAGFCWTKVHAPTSTDVELGEIFVIGVDPSRQGTGLGRALVLGGLASLAERGVRTGMLFVDAANEGAVRLYASLGFTTSRVDRAYERTV